MNKYLYEKIEQAHSAYFENLIFLSSEFCRENMSDTFEEFTELEPIEIAKVLGWNTKEETLQLIKDNVEEKELSSLLFQNNMTGFLAECHLPHHSKFMFNDGQERPWGSTVHCGTLRVEWIYAESIGELVEKLEDVAECFYVESYEKERSELSTSKAEL